MATVSTSPAPRRRSTSARAPARSPSRSGIVAFVGALAYFVLEPLVRLQSKAFADGADGYRTAFTADRIGAPSPTRSALALGSLAIALVLGTLLAWAASRLPPRLRILRVVPVLPIVVPAIASVVGWAFLLSPRPGYLNAALRNLPWWSDLEEGPIDIYTMPWIVIITGFGLTAFVYLFVSAGFENISAEHLEAAQVAGSSPLGGVLPGDAAAAAPDAASTAAASPCCSASGSSPARCCSARTAGIDVITTQIYRDMSQTPVQYGIGGGARLDAARVRRGRRGAAEDAARRPAALRHPRRQGVPPTGPPVEARRPSPSSPTRPSPPCCPSARSIVVSLSTSSGAPRSTSAASRSTTSARSSTSPTSPTPSTTASPARCSPSLISLPLGFIAASIILRGTRYRAAADGRRLPRRRSPSASPPCCSAPASSSPTPKDRSCCTAPAGSSCSSTSR